MALLFATGFNGITTATIARRFTFAGGGTVSVASNGRYGQCAESVDALLAYEVPANYDTVYFGAWLKVTATNAADCRLLNWASDDAGEGSNLQVTYTAADDTLKFRLPADGYSNPFTSAAIGLDTWFFLEIRLTSHVSAGVLTVKINGTQVYAGTGLVTKDATTGTGVKGFAIGEFGGDTEWRCDSLYWCDDTGSAPHNTFLGPIRVDKVDTSANDSVQFTPLSSTNESNIDDGNSPDDDTSYNESSTLNHRDTFTIAGYKATSHKVFAVIARAVAKASAADGRELRTVINNGSVVTGTSTSIDNTGYIEVSQNLEIASSAYASPEAAETAINALKVGYEISA